jgi:hypothetical protein
MKCVNAYQRATTPLILASDKNLHAYAKVRPGGIGPRLAWREAAGEGLPADVLGWPLLDVRRRVAPKFVFVFVDAKMKSSLR